MRVRVHKNRSLDRNRRPCRCWIVLSIDPFKNLGSCESILLRDVRFDGSDTWSSGWAIGELVWTDELVVNGREPEKAECAMCAEGSDGLQLAPEDGWERLTFRREVGFRVNDLPVDGADWMMLTPWHDAVFGARPPRL